MTWGLWIICLVIFISTALNVILFTSWRQALQQTEREKSRLERASQLQALERESDRDLMLQSLTSGSDLSPLLRFLTFWVSQHYRR